jgi:hypothetical protein
MSANIIQYHDLFNHCDKSLVVNDVLTILYQIESYYYTLISVNYNNKINYYASEWLYLLSDKYYPVGHYYNYIVDHSNEILNNKLSLPKIFINEDVLQFFNTFSKGTVHGFTGFYYTIIEYINNYEKYKHLKLVFLKDSDTGMLDIIKYLCDKGLIDKDKIIYININNLYLFKSVTFIPNKHHVFNPEFIPIIDKFISSHLIIPYVPIYKKNNVCIMKADDSFNCGGAVTKIYNKDITDFCDKYNFTSLNNYNEIDKVNIINNCKVLIVSYGSAFYKNFVYISDKCEKIIVIVSGEYYINHYKNLSASLEDSTYAGFILPKYKNADIKYIIRNDLDFDPNNII